MTTSGEPPSGAGDVSEPDWIDQILERATQQVDSASAAKRDPLPIVPEPPAESTSRRDPEQEAKPDQPQDRKPNPQPDRQGAPKQDRPQAQKPMVRRAPVVHDGLAEIRWADTPQVTPASTPIAAPTGEQPVAASTPGPQHRTGTTELVPEAVGRSAWDGDLARLDDVDPEGWDKLSWTDLEGNDKPSPQRAQEATSFGRLLREWGPVLVAAIAIALFTRLVLVQAYHIPSQSMVPTLQNGDRVVVNRLSYQFGEIERGQVVVFAKPPGTDGENDLIKRVIGLPGETIRFVDEQVYIDGLRVEEPYLAQQNSTRPGRTIPGCAQVDPAADLCLVPEGHIFVMGDNRLGSSDSRVFGPVATDTVVGRAFVRVWPLNHLGEL